MFKVEAESIIAEPVNEQQVKGTEINAALFLVRKHSFTGADTIDSTTRFPEREQRMRPHLSGLQLEGLKRPVLRSCMLVADLRVLGMDVPVIPESVQADVDSTDHLVLIAACVPRTASRTEAWTVA